MNPIVHLSLKVDDVQQAGDFYRTVFGFRDVETRRTRDHVSRHMTDGAIDFTLTQYDAEAPSAGSRAAGDEPCPHHFALEVEDIAKWTDLVKANGGEIISAPGALPVKFRAVGATVAELVPPGGFKQPVGDGTICRIVKIALKVDDVRKTGEFYRWVLGFEDVTLEQTRHHIARHMTDGRIDFSLIRCHASALAGETPCIHHFALGVEDVERAAAQVKAYGCKLISEPGTLPVKFHAPGGTLTELVPIGRYPRGIAQPPR